MPEDPLGLLLAQASANFETMNRSAMALAADLSKMAAQAATAPLQALQALGKGAGYYSAKMSTAELRRRNIFGE